MLDINRIFSTGDPRLELLDRAYHAAGMERLFHLQKLAASITENTESCATIQAALGDALNESGNEDGAVAAYQAALGVFSSLDLREEWAEVAIKLASVLLHTAALDRHRRLEQGIEFATAAIQILDKSKQGELWAEAQRTIGMLYLNLGGAAHDVNIEKAIASFEAATSVLDKQQQEEQWAMVQNNLGLAYLYRVKEQKPANLRQSLQYLQAALSVFDRKRHPAQWAQTTNNIGTVYLQRNGEDREQDLEKALEAYEAILDIYTKGDFPAERAKTQVNLAESYRNRIAGDKPANLEKAIDCCQSALGFFTRARFPLDWARVQLHLGNLLAERMVGDPLHNLEDAITAFQQALQIYSKADTPTEWGSVQINLGKAWRGRLAGEKPSNLQQAIIAYGAASEVFTQKNNPFLWAVIQNNLGNSYQDLTAGNIPENQENAIGAFQAAIQVFTKDAYPVPWAMTKNNLGVLYLNRLSGDPNENLLAAADFFLAALEIRTRAKLPEEFLRTSRNLGEVYYRQKNWGAALFQFKQAIDTADNLRETAENEVGHSRLSRDMAACYRLAIAAAVMLGDLTETALLTINGKARTLAGRMLGVRLSASMKDQDPPGLAKLMSDLTELEKVILTSDAPEKERARRREMIERLSVDFPVFAAINYRAPVTKAGLWETISQAGNIPVVDFVQHEMGWGALVYHDQKVHYFPLAGDLDQSLAGIIQEIQEGSFWTTGNYRAQLHKIYQLVLAPIRSLLPPSGPLLISPTGMLHLLPFQALTDREGQYLCAAYAITFIPSLAILPILGAQRRLALNGDSGATLLNVAHPGNPGQANYMPQTVKAEMDAVASCFDAGRQCSLALSEATPAAVLRQANSRPWRVIHINCHGDFNEEDPARSGLALEGNRLTIQDIILQLRLPGHPLVTLSACQTGQLKPEQADENTGLTTAFLVAGASATLSSLWSIPAGPTRLLMELFYKYWKAAPKTAAEALQMAMEQLRSRDAMVNPLYWAAFQVTGLPYLITKTE